MAGIDGDEDPHFPFSERYPVPEGATGIVSAEEFQRLYEESTTQPEQFWRRVGAETLTWSRPFTTVMSGGFQEGDIAWFADGELNACYNCVDRHLATRADQVAIIWEGDNANEVRKVTFAELHRMVCRMANALKTAGVRRGDNVVIYMANCIECASAMLACARIGAPHSIVFAGFSSEALAQRIQDCRATLLLTSTHLTRAGKVVPLKEIADEALERCPSVKHVLVMASPGDAAQRVHLVAGRDAWLHTAMERERPYCPCAPMSAEDVLFLLYTSGSTGRAKGLVHTTGGYMVYAALTHKYTFGCKPGDIYACVADVGWITGHSYVVYGPLANGVTTFMFESTPLWPDAGRYWDMVQRHSITHFYTAPTAIRALMTFGDAPVLKHDLSTLRVLGSVGEPINGDAWRWYKNVVGQNGRCSVIDTFWQTESGGHMLTPVSGVSVTKPGSCGRPFLGQQLVLLDDKGHLLGAPTGDATSVTGVLAASQPWPGIARTIFGDHARYLATYMSPYPGYYFTGDRAARDLDSFFWIRGRVDDVINVSGHRLGTAEIETALLSHVACSEGAAIAIPHDIKGQCVVCFVVLKHNFVESASLISDLRNQVRHSIGGFAVPDHVYVVSGLPKTRSGKIMRRILRKIATHESSPEQLGDLTTLADPNVVRSIILKLAPPA